MYIPIWHNKGSKCQPIVTWHFLETFASNHIGRWWLCQSWHPCQVVLTCRCDIAHWWNRCFLEWWNPLKCLFSRSLSRTEGTLSLPSMYIIWHTNSFINIPSNCGSSTRVSFVAKMFALKKWQIFHHISFSIYCFCCFPQNNQIYLYLWGNI